MSRPLFLGIPYINKDISIKYFAMFGDECLPMSKGKRGKPTSFKTKSGEPTYKEKIIYCNVENRYEGMRDPF